METTVKWLGNDGMAFSAETGSGHLVNMDGAPDAGGRNLAPRPMEMMLVGAGGCTCFDVVMILKRARQDIQDCKVELQAERAEEDPKIFTKIHMDFTLIGDIDPAKADRAAELGSPNGGVAPGWLRVDRR